MAKKEITTKSKATASIKKSETKSVKKATSSAASGKTVNDYVKTIDADKKDAFEKLRAIITKNIPKGFEETISYNMPAFVVPHKLYPNGYHCKPSEPLPFISIAAQKNAISVYHMGMYMDKKLYDWFVAEYPKHCKTKIDIGKSCIKFKKVDDIPYNLVAELVKKVTVKEWIANYESVLKK